MVKEPIVIRKSRGALIVSSSVATDPIQLVRQLNLTELEVHLKNGSKYVENVEGVDMDQIILEMMGYAPHELELSFAAWPSDQEGGIKFVDKKLLQKRAEQCMPWVFEHTPYMTAKLSKAELEFEESEDIEYYDGFYRKYEVFVKFYFLARVDMHNEIYDAFEHAESLISKNFHVSPQRIGTNDFSIKIRTVE